MNRMSHADYFKFATALQNRADNGVIDMRPGTLAKELSEALGLLVSGDQVRRAAEKHGITMRFNSKSAWQPEPISDDVQAQLDRIESMLKRICITWEVDF